jgi:hypothetical protein
MTENSSSAVGRAAIDAYLDSVELALIAAEAPRVDRVQVLQDLEAQIADMLAQQPTPLTEESVRTVLDKLEPPSHFATTYGNGKQAAPLPMPSVFSRLPRAPWPLIATISCALLCIACLFVVFAAAMNDRGMLDFLTLLVLATVILTPVALWMAHRQLRADPGTPRRDLVLKSTAAYAAIVTTLVLLFLVAITDGFVLTALGVVAFVYFEYLLIRRIWRHMAEALPPQPASSPTRDTNGNSAHAPVASATPMPAV